MKKKFRLFVILTVFLGGLGVGLYYYIQNVAEAGFNNWVFENRNEFQLTYKKIDIDFMPPSVALHDVAYTPKGSGTYKVKQVRVFSWDFMHEPPEKMRAEFDGLDFNGMIPVAFKGAIASLTGGAELPPVNLHVDYNLDSQRNLLHLNDIFLGVPNIGDFTLMGYLENVNFSEGSSMSNLGTAIRSGSLTFIDKGFFTGFLNRLSQMSGKDNAVILDELKKDLKLEEAKYLAEKDMVTVKALKGIEEFLDVPVGLSFRIAPEEAFPLLYLFSDREVIDFADQMNLSIEAHEPPME